MKFQSYKSNEIGLEFKVWAPSFNRVDQRLYLLGSLKELGAWAIESALEAYPTKDLQIWNVQTALPPKSRFEWVWLKIDTKTKKVVWERPVKRNRIVGCFSGVLHTVWGEHEEVFLQSATHVDVTTFKKVEEGSVLALTGSAITLGNWDPRRTVVASEFPNKSGFWKARFCFDAHTNIEFKWVVVDDKARDNVIAAEKLPHKLYGRNTWIRVAAPWMTTSAVVVDILPLDEKLDNQMGRTDMIVQARMKRMTEIRSWMAKGRVAINLQRPFASFTTIRQSQTYTDIVHDADVCAALKALWTIVPKENDELDQRPTTDQQRKGSLSSSKTRDIKGVGQTHVPTDATNMDVIDQVPLLECGLILLPTSRHETAVGYQKEVNTAASIAKDDAAQRISQPLSRDIIDTKKFYPLSRHRGPDRLSQMYRNLEKKFEAFSQTNPSEFEGKSEVQLSVEQVVGNMPFTWSMLYEAEMDKMRSRVSFEEPDLDIDKPKRGGKKARMRHPWAQKPEPKKPTLAEVFKQKEQSEIITEAAAAARGRFSLYRAEGGQNLEPATLGRDDTSKSEEDLTEENRNRMSWDRSRSETSVLSGTPSTSARPSLVPPSAARPSLDLH